MSISMSKASSKSLEDFVPKLEKSGDVEKDVEVAKIESRDGGEPYSIYSANSKRFIVFMVSVSALISPLAATLYLPALNPISAQLGVSNSLINLTITSYMIFQAIAPAIVAGISDNGGRRLGFIICFAIFTVANIGLALQTDYAALLVLRMVQSSGSSSTIALSIAVVADIATSAERGKWTGYATAGILLGPSFGPTIGGALAQYLGWRSIFWFLAIFSGVFLFLFVFFFPETCRKVVGNGSIPAKGLNRSVLGYLQEKKNGATVPARLAENATGPRKTKSWKSWLPNPWTTLKIFKDGESALLLAYNGLAFCPNMLVTASLPSMLAETYKYNDLKVGLCYLPFGFGALAASIMIGYLMDWNFRRHAKRVGLVLTDRQPDLTGFPLERARIEVILPNHFMTLISIVSFGWAMDVGTSIAVPEVLLFCIGFFITSAFNVSNTMLVDLHRDTPAATGAATNLSRCLISAGGVAMILPLIAAVGRGWAFTIIGGIYILLTPALWALLRYGPRWRMEKHLKALESKQQQECRA